MVKRFGKWVGGVGSAVASSVAFAQASDPVTTAFTDLSAKVTGYSAGLIALAVVGVGIAIGVKYVKKARGAA